MTKTQLKSDLIGLGILSVTVVTTLLGLLCVLAGRVDGLRQLIRCWARVILKLMGVRIDLVNSQYSQLPNVIYVANHTSYLDTFTFPSFLPPDTRYVSKIELAQLGPISWLCKKAGYVFLDRKNPRASIRQLQEMMRAPSQGPVLIHPEGTRSRSGELLPLKSGLRTLIHSSSFDVVPVVTVGGEKLWPHGQLISNPGVLQIRFGQPIPAEALARLPKDALLGLVRERLLELQR